MIDLLVEYRHWSWASASSACSSGRRWPASAAFAGWRGNAAMSRDRKGSPSVSPSESSEAWLESHASELVDCGRMRCRMLARHCGTRESCFRGGRCPKAPRGARPVQTERASMPMYYANPDC